MSSPPSGSEPQLPRPRRPADPPDRTGASFVGRGAELGVLEGGLALAGEGTAGTVVVGADAGVGKSRLVAEFRARAADGGACVLAGECVSLGAGVIPYAPLIDALRRYVREHGEETFRTVAGPAYAELANLVSDFSGSGSPAEPTTEQRVFGAVLRLLDRLGGDAPVVLVIEDLHWADPSTLDLVAYLARAQTTERSLLVCTYRSGESDMTGALRTMLAELVRARRVTRVDLPPFTRGELREFLAGGDAEAVDRCFDLCAGNAFYAEELAHAGILAAAGNGAVALPGSVSELVMARVGRLDRDARRVIRIAATAGRQVSHRLLATVSELGRWDLVEAVRQCSEQRLLESESTSSTYVFQHALVREAVYQTLVAGERIMLHEAMAEALTADAGLSYAEDLTVAVELAHHWERAENIPRALAASVHAGDAAVRIRAFAAAETQYDRALRLWVRVAEPERVAGRRHDEILVAAADAARWAGHANRAVDLVRRALAEVDPGGERRRVGELHERLGSYLWEAGRSAESHRAYGDARDLLAGESSALAARVLAGLATANVRLGNCTAALADAEAAAAMAADVGALAEEGRAHNTAGVALTLLGRADEGIARCREALRIARAVDHLEDLFRAYSNLVYVLENAGRLEEAVERARDGLALSRELGVERTRQGLVLANNAAAALAVLGRWDEAVEMLTDTLRNKPVEESRYPRLTLAEIRVGRGEFREAEELIEPLRRDEDSARYPQFGGPLHACLAELAIWRGDRVGARAAVEAGIEVALAAEADIVLLRLCALGLRVEADDHSRPDALERSARLASLVAMPESGSPELREATALRLQCAAERARVTRSDTVADWAAVVDAWHEMRRPYPSAYARWRLAAAALRAGDPTTAQIAMNRARADAEDLSAEPLLDEIIALVHDARVVEMQSPLTRRELQVLRLVSQGKTNREIANDLFITESTVSVHMTNLMNKLKAGNRTEAASIGRQRGLVADDRRS